MSGQTAVTIGIMAGFAVLLGAAAIVQKSDLAILAGCFAATASGLTVMLESERRRRKTGLATCPRRTRTADQPPRA